MIDSSLITSDESMVISPNNTINQSGQKKRITSTPAVTTPVWKNADEYAFIMTSDRSRTANINTSDSSDWSINEQQDNPITSTKIIQTSTPDRPSGPLLEERSERTLFDEQGEDSEEPSWSETALQRLRESEKQGMINKKYKPLKPIVESQFIMERYSTEEIV